MVCEEREEGGEEQETMKKRKGRREMQKGREKDKA